MTKKEKLVKIIQSQSYEKKEVILSSGKKSNFYIDGKMTTTDPEGAYLVGQLMYDLIKSLNVDGVGGLTMGADPIATAIAMISHLAGKPIQGFLVRKETKKHGKGLDIEGGYGLRKGSHVVIVEDVVTTGAATLQAIKKVEDAEFVVKKVIALVDREEGGREAIQEAGYSFDPLFKKKDIETKN